MREARANARFSAAILGKELRKALLESRSVICVGVNILLYEMVMVEVKLCCVTVEQGSECRGFDVKKSLS